MVGKRNKKKEERNVEEGRETAAQVERAEYELDCDDDNSEEFGIPILVHCEKPEVASQGRKAGEQKWSL